jgi:tRNA(Ile)-lysidine synthase TilS/MesJ
LAWYPNENAVKPALGNSTTVESFQFRENEHSGAAPLDEIQQGYEDGELSDACQIYNPSKDTWGGIGDFLKSRRLTSTKKKMPTNPTDDKMEIKKDQYVGNDKKELVVFRDGERTGEAPWGEIEAGYEDGELSNQCEIYDPKVDRCENIDSIVQQKRPPTDDAGGLKMSAGTKAYDLPVVEKNEKKKPQRDSSTWGQGSMVPLKPQNEANGEMAHVLPSKRKKSKHIKPPPKMMRLVTQAMIQWDMLQDGDRLLLGLSGGKDSMSLLHVLLEFQKKLPIQFEIEVCTIDPMTPSFDPSPLISYVESLGLKYHYIRDDIVERATKAGKGGKMVSSLCAFCARMKRGNLYSCARKNNCNKLVLAQHLDDLAESFMMSVMHNGFLRTMKAHYKINAGDLSVIRPLAYCRESLMTDFAKSANLPIINENCPACFEEPKERERIKKLLSREETLYPNFYDSIKRALLPLMHDDATAILRSYTEEALAKSRKENLVKKRPNGSKPTSRNGKNSKTNEGKEEMTGPDGDNGDSRSSQVRAFAETIEINSGKINTFLSEASEEELTMELARRRAERFRLAGAMKRLDDDDDPTGQVCSLRGGNGSIPCRELME